MAAIQDLPPPMSERASTKGPWRVDHNHAHYVVCDHAPMVVAVCGSSLSAGTREANAALIAAAPDMFEALWQCIGALKALGAQDGYASTAAKAALAKAEGLGQRADATPNPSDLSSLRKGAEVVGWMFTHEDGTRSFVSDPDTKRIWEETMKRELVPVAALVSGSREDGADAND